MLLGCENLSGDASSSFDEVLSIVFSLVGSPCLVEVALSSFVATPRCKTFFSEGHRRPSTLHVGETELR